MAKRRTSIVRRVRYGARRVARRSSRRGSSLFGGTFGPAIAGLVGGIAAQVGNRFLGSYGTPLGYGAAGYLMKNDTLMTMAGIGASALLPVGSLLGGSSNSNSGAI